MKKYLLTTLTLCANLLALQTIEITSDSSIKKEFAAQVYSKSEVAVSSRSSGFIKKISVEEGDSVKKGQLLFEIDPTSAKAELNMAKKDLDRYKTLLDSGVISEREFEKIQLTYELKKEQFSYSVVTSPVNGVVTKKFLNVGSIAMPSQPVLAISGTDDLRVQAVIDEKDAVGVKIGNSLSVLIPTLNKNINSKVVSITPNPTAPHSFLLKVSLSDTKDLSAGMYAKIQLAKNTSDTVLISPSAITKRGGISGVFSINGSIAKFIPITIVSQNSDNVEVRGVKKGQKLILYPKATLADGQKAE